MRKPVIMFTTFAALVLLAFLSGFGVGTNVIYRSVLVLAMLLRFGWMAAEFRRRPAQSR